MEGDRTDKISLVQYFLLQTNFAAYYNTEPNRRDRQEVDNTCFTDCFANTTPELSQQSNAEKNTRIGKR